MGNSFLNVLDMLFVGLRRNLYMFAVFWVIVSTRMLHNASHVCPKGSSSFTHVSPESACFFPRDLAEFPAMTIQQRDTGVGGSTLPSETVSTCCQKNESTNEQTLSKKGIEFIDFPPDFASNDASSTVHLPIHATPEPVL